MCRRGAGDAWLEPWSGDGRGTNVVVVRWALMARLIAAYGALAYSRGWLGRVVDRVWPPPGEG